MKTFQINKLCSVFLLLCCYWQFSTGKNGKAFTALEDTLSPQVRILNKIVYTDGGNSHRAPCVFPFKYKGKIYTKCSTVDELHEGRTWCATTSDYDTDKKWGHCLTERAIKMCFDKNKQCGTQTSRGECFTNSVFMNEVCPRSCGICTFGGNSDGKACVFPFIYKDKIWTKCIKTQGKKWCATTSNYDQHKKWGYCYQKVFEDLSSINDYYMTYGECDDRDLKCPIWAVSGECASNPTFMESTCAWSCRKCAPSELLNHSECKDYSQECAKWADDGECRSKPVFMYAFCRYTCRECSNTVEKSGVIDTNPKCTEWADNGDCKNNPEYMLTTCPKACMSGGYINQKKCIDKFSECREWAKEGYCDTNKILMNEVCPFSCGACKE